MWDLDMKILETPWEKRNLDVNGVEFYFDQSDSLENITEQVLCDKIHNYQVAHFPVGRMDIHNKLNENGFLFAETKFELIADLKMLELPQIFSRYENMLQYHKIVTDKEKKEIYNAMKNGIFNTDKVALDSKFGLQKAGYRYATWVDQVIKEGSAIPYIVTCEEDNIGFFILKILEKKTGDSFLAALFNNDLYKGFGFSVLYYPMLQAKKMGMRKIKAGVSSNNPASLKMHLALGYQIKNLHYIMVKHLENDNKK